MSIKNKYLDLANNVWKEKDHPDVSRAGQAQPPVAPTGVSVTAHTQNSLTVGWTPATTTGITEVRIFRSLSATGTFTRVATITGNTATSYTDPGLTAGTVYYYKLASYNATLNLTSAFSTPTVNGTTDQIITGGAPNPVTGLTATKSAGSPTDTINVAWTAPAVDGSHSAATGYKVYGDGTLLTPTPITATSYVISWPIPGDVVTVAVRATNATGDGALTTAADVNLDDPPPPTGEYTILMGTSRSNSGKTVTDYSPPHGGIADQFEAVRVYDATIAAFTDVMNVFPNAVAFGVTDATLETSNVTNKYATLFENFYYNTDGTPRTGRRSPTTGIQLHVGNGNEYGDKITSGNWAGWQTGVRSIYTATRTQNSNGTRRYPLTSVWLDPTHNQEQTGTGLAVSLQQSLESVADVLDGIAWSMYPPGRKDASGDDPTYNLPVPSNPATAPSSVTAAQRNSADGFLERCFYRTDQTAKSVSASKKIKIAIWEIGTGQDPSDPDTRPWYVAKVLARWCYERAKAYPTIEQMVVACWWDQEKSGAGNPKDVFSDEPQTATLSLNAPFTSSNGPHTSYAWVHWKELIPHYGGTRPPRWPTTPKAAWKTSGTYAMTET